MKKRVKNINVNISNRAFYSILTLAISIIFVAGVFAFGTSTPSSFGHSAKELDLSSGVDGNAVFNGNINVGGDIGVTGGIQTAGAIESTSGGIKLPDGTTILSSDDLGSSSSANENPLQVGGAYIEHLTGSSPQCNQGAIVIRDWNSRTCCYKDGTGTHCGVDSCSTGSGWGINAPTCTYMTLNNDAAVCTASSWTEAVCLGN